MHRPILLLTAVLSLLQSVQAVFCFDSTGKSVAGISATSAAHCIVTKDLGNGNVEFTFFSSAKGWFGFGVSSVADSTQMGPGDVAVAYNDQSNTVQALSFLTGAGGGVINANPNRVWTKTDLNGTAPAWAAIAVSVLRSTSTSGQGSVALSIGVDASITPNNFIMAWSDSALVFGSNNAIGLSPHGPNKLFVKGRIQQGSSGLIAIPQGFTINQVILVHAIIMCLALVLLPPIGIFFAMFMREKLGSSWVGVHLGIMIGGVGLLSLIGAVFIFLFQQRPLLSSIHQIMGVVVIVLVILQIVFGFVAKSGYSPLQPASPIMSQVHRYFGAVLYILIIPAQIYLGFQEYASVLGTSAPMYLVAVPAVFGLIGIILLVAGYFTLPYGESSFNLATTGGFPFKDNREFVQLQEPARSAGGSRNGRPTVENHYAGGFARGPTAQAAYGAGSGNARQNEYYNQGGNDNYNQVSNEHHAQPNLPSAIRNDYYAEAPAAAPSGGGREYDRTRSANRAGGAGQEYEYKPRSTTSRTAGGGSGNGREYNGSRVRGQPKRSEFEDY